MSSFPLAAKRCYLQVPGHQLSTWYRMGQPQNDCARASGHGSRAKHRWKGEESVAAESRASTNSRVQYWLHRWT